jgi:hypothetical protein
MRRSSFARLAQGCSLVVLTAMLMACSRQPQSIALKKLAPGAEFAGFLSDYTKLQPNPRSENTLAYVKHDDAKNIHKYIAVIVEPVEIYIATNADPAKIPDRGRTALAAYFQGAIARAVSDAFPVVQEPGPLVLRLRTALIGVDSGGVIPADQSLPGVSEALARAVDIGKVAIEMEMVDSMTGEQIAAAVDRKNLGAGAVIGSAAFSHEEKFAAATEALDGWASRLREFLDSAEELSQADERRADESYQPYSDAPKARR